MTARATNPLTRNLDALRRNNPGMAEAVEAADPAALTWTQAKPGAVSATRNLDDGTALTLASKYDPQGEADRLIRDLREDHVASAALLGFGLGYHAQRALQQLGQRGLLVIFEPDVAQLRAVLEHLDHSTWLGDPNVVWFGPDADRSEMTAALEVRAATLTQGTKLITHPPGRRLHREAYARFSDDLTEVMSFCRTNLATALVNAARTSRNLAMNLGLYAAGATTEELKDAAKGFPAVCVSAGPSLVRNVELLADPAVRRRVVVIAVQTALQPLLDRGIRPDFVTALDYSPICARFYEGLPDLPDVTLVAEPKANCAILDAFPGPVRMLKNDFNDKLLGGLARPRTAMRSGATVAHLSVYLADHLGCDPVILVGQDLGFSDGLYYAPGTAVHRVWEPELSPFNTIEMMEWVRIARMRGSLRRMEDVRGNPCFTDEQMVTYLKQFERDFKDMSQRGIAVIDGTEGGIPKQHCTTMPLAEALQQHATREVPAIPVPPRQPDPDLLRKAARQLDGRLDELHRLRKLCVRSVDLLQEMKRKADQPVKLDKLFAKLDAEKSVVFGELRTVFELINAVNVIGAFRRQRSDRLIERAGESDTRRMLQQLDRDEDNLSWLGQACDETLVIFEDARERLGASLAQSPEKKSSATITVHPETKNAATTAA